MSEPKWEFDKTVFFTDQGWMTQMRVANFPYSGYVTALVVELHNVMADVPQDLHHLVKYEFDVDRDYYGGECSCTPRLDITYLRPATEEEIVAEQKKRNDKQAEENAWEYQQYERLRAKFGHYR